MNSLLIFSIKKFFVQIFREILILAVFVYNILDLKIIQVDASFVNEALFYLCQSIPLHLLFFRYLIPDDTDYFCINMQYSLVVISELIMFSINLFM